MAKKIDADEMLAELLFKWEAVVDPRAMLIGLTELIKQAKESEPSLERTTKLLKLHIRYAEIKSLFPNVNVS